jgi:serine protease Do
MIMKKTWVKISAFVFAVALMAPVSLLAQKEEKEKTAKEEKVKEKKDVRQIIVTTKGDKDEKIVVEVIGDKITVNGKPVEEYGEKGEHDINVRINKLKDLSALTYSRTGKGGSTFSYNGDGQYNLFSTADTNQAMLGVTTDKTDEGVKIQDITEKSGAEKAGLKEGDIITKIDDKKIEDPDDLSKEIRAHKPGDKVSVTYLRDKKEQKITAELGKWKGLSVFGKVNGFDMNGMNFDKMVTPRALTMPRTTYGQNFSWSGGSPKLGISVQDTDDGKGVKVIEVDEESNAAKAGVKEDDVISEVDGKTVNSTDEMVKVIKESKEKASVMIKLQRAGKTQSIEVKMPKKIKTADL